MTALQNWANGNIDTTNLDAATSQAAGINTAGAKVKGTVLNAGPGTRTNTVYGALGDAADQVTGITLATNGLLRVWFSAQWQESVVGTARAAILIGANQLKVQSGVGGGSPGVITQAAATLFPTNANTSLPLTSCSQGLVTTSQGGGNFGADATTGQVVGFVAPIQVPSMELGGTVIQLYQGASDSTTVVPFGGPCDVFAAAGTYTIAVNYKSSSGTVTASNRHLWVQAISFG